MEMAESMKVADIGVKVAEKAAKKTAKKAWGCMTFMLNLLAMVIVVVLLLVGVIWWLDGYTHHGEAVEVPDLQGVDYSRAMRMLDEKGLLLVANDSTYIKEMAAGAIVLQQPVPGSKVKAGRVIYVTINSLTLPREVIPDLIENSSYREAQAKLAAIGFEMLPPILVDGEKDWVLGIKCEGRNLVAGDMVARGSQLSLVIGNGLVGDEASFVEWGDAGSEADLETGGEDETDTFVEVDEAGNE